MTLDIYGKTPTVFDSMSQGELLCLMAAILKKAGVGEVILLDSDIRTLGDRGECLAFWRTHEGYHFQVMSRSEAELLYERTRHPTIN